MPHRFRFARILVAVAVALGTLSVASQPASAAPLNVCTGTESATYSPSIKVAAAPTTVTAEATVACAGDAAHPSAQVSFVGIGTLSCLTGGTTTGTGHIDWSNAAHSTSDFSFSLAVGARPVGEQILVATGTVSSGDYAGQSVTFTFQLLNASPLDCLGDGIGSVAGPIEAVFGA